MTWLHMHSARPSGRRCQHDVTGGEDSFVAIDIDGEGGARVRGLQNCGSVWACPHCAPVRRLRRGRGIERTVREWLEQGGRIVFGTTTLPHRAAEWVDDDGLPDAAGLFDTVAEGWSRMTSGKAWADFKRRIGLHGMYRAAEATWNTRQRLPHAHLHWLMFIEPTTSLEKIEELMESQRERWLRYIETVIDDLDDARRTAAREVAFVWEVVTSVERSAVGRYLTKLGYGLGAELTSASKKAKQKINCSPWDLLARAVAGQRGFAAAFNSWERASEGHRMLTASGCVPTVKELEALGAEDDDSQDARNWQQLCILRAADWDHLVVKYKSVEALLAFAGNSPDQFMKTIRSDLALIGSGPDPPEEPRSYVTLNPF
jgi:hypothetical protein